MGPSRAAVIVAVLAIVALIAGWAFISSGQQEAPSGPLTEVADTSAIQNTIQLSHLSIATSENFARQKIYVISGYIKNLSEKPLRMAEVKMVFTDFDGKPIHEYSEKILDQKQKSLPPGSEMRFEIRQENLPRGWNYRLPVTEVTKLGH